MAIDWDKNVFKPVAGVFGEQVTYLPASGSPFGLTDAIFEQAYRHLVLMDDGSAVTTETPALTVRLSEFPAGTMPKQNDRVQVPSVNSAYVVREAQLDSHGLAKLLLSLTGALS